jgi:hypothetical protein
MEMNGQISNSKKSEMSNWAKQYSYQLTAEQIQAVENNDCSKFKTTSGGKETMSQIWKEQPFGDVFGQKYAESYDEASWFRARCAFLQYRNYELEEQMKFLDCDGKPCDRCNEPVCYEGNEGKISERDEAIICSECYARESDEDREVETSDDEDDEILTCERCEQEEQEGEEFKDYGGDILCPKCYAEAEDSCDCCVKGWSKANEFGRCVCCCSDCKKLLRNCRYECTAVKQE